MRRVGASILAALLTSSLAGVVAAVSSGSIADPLIVTRETPGYLPPTCSIRGIGATANGFFDAFNRGSKPLVARYVASAKSFWWYSSTEGTLPRRHFVTYSRSGFLSYMVRRHRRNERLRLMLLDAASGVRPGAAAIHFVIQRTATDLPPGLGGNLRIAEGKAEFYCRTQRIYVWSMGMEMASGLDVPPHVGWSCPKPTDWSVQSRDAFGCTRI
ncbi:MAG: hypothetical protein V7645_1505 [Actinomycetota bacterium]|jgi:hypothetical protein